MLARAWIVFSCFALAACGHSKSADDAKAVDAGRALAAFDAEPDEEDTPDGTEEAPRKEGTKQASTTLSRRVRKLSLEAEEIAAIFAKIPKLAELAPELRLYAEPYDVNVVRRRGKSEQVEGWNFSAVPVLWTPAGGKPHLVVTGKSGKNAFVVALERLDDGGYELASSIIFRNDPGPFVLAYQNDPRERILWSSCWQCSGEGGAIVARDEGKRVVVIHY